MDAQQNAGLTICMSKVTLAAGTTTGLSSTGASVYCLKGKAYTGIALSSITTTTDINTGVAFLPVPANYGSVFLVGMNAAGTSAVAQGSIEALDVSGKFINAPKLPAVPDNFCPIGYILIQVGSTGSAWTYGTSNLSGATGVTYTFQDLIALPDRLQVPAAG